MVAINTYLRYRELVIVRYNQRTSGESAAVGHRGSPEALFPLGPIFALSSKLSSTMLRLINASHTIVNRSY